MYEKILDLQINFQNDKAILVRINNKILFFSKRYLGTIENTYNVDRLAFVV